MANKKYKKYKQQKMEDIKFNDEEAVVEGNTGQVEFSSEMNQEAQQINNDAENDVDFENKSDIDAQAMEFDYYKQQIDAQRSNMEMYMHMAQQLQADFDNYRKRNANIATESKKEGIVQAVNSLLPAYDALVEGLKMINDENTKKGLEMVERVFLQSLSELGIYPIESLNKPFDPKFHNAIMTEEVLDVESGTIIQEFSKGFVDADGNVVRVATVKTAR